MTKKHKPARPEGSGRREKKAGGSAKPSATPAPAIDSPREFADAVLERCDAVRVGCQLLEGEAERGSSVKASFLKTLLEFKFGKPAPADATLPRVLWCIPRPVRE